MTVVRGGAGDRHSTRYDRGWAWFVMLGVFLDCFIMMGTMKSYGLFLEALVEKFDISLALASLPISVCNIIYSCGSPFALTLSEAFGVRRVVIVGAVVGFIGISFSSMLVNIEFFIVTFGLSTGIIYACLYANGLVMIGRYFNKRLSIATGLALAGSSIGQFLMPPIIEYLMENFALTGTLAILAAFHLNGAVAGFLFRPVRRYSKELPGLDKSTDLAKSDDNGGELKDELKSFKDYEDHSLYPEGSSAVYNSSMSSAKGSFFIGLPNTLIQPKNTSELQTQEQLINSVYPRPNTPTDTGKSGSRYLEVPVPPCLCISNSCCSFTYCNQTQKQLLIPQEDAHSQDSIETEDDISDNSFDGDKALRNVENLASSNQQLAILATKSASTQTKKFERKIFDFGVVRSHITQWYVLIAVLVYFGYFNFSIFLPPLIANKGFEAYEKAMLVSFCGIGDLIARVATGFVADFKCIKRYKLQAVCGILCGLNIVMAIFANTFAWMAIHYVAYGMFGGACTSILSVVLLDMVGRSLVSKNLGIMLPAQGVTIAIGQIVLGYVKDSTGNFTMLISVLAGCTIFGSILLFLYPVVRRAEDRRLERRACTCGEHGKV